MKYTMEFSENQLKIMKEALHSYARMQVGQLKTALEPITFLSDVKDKLNETQQKWLDELTLYEHNQMHGHTEESEIAWDIYQVLRHQLWKENPNRGSCVADSVNKRGTEDLPNLRKNNEEVKIKFGKVKVGYGEYSGNKLEIKKEK